MWPLRVIKKEKISAGRMIAVLLTPDDLKAIISESRESRLYVNRTANRRLMGSNMGKKEMANSMGVLNRIDPPHNEIKRHVKMIIDGIEIIMVVV